MKGQLTIATGALLVAQALASPAYANIIGTSTGSVDGGLRFYGLGDGGLAAAPDAMDGRGNVVFDMAYNRCVTSAGTRTCSLTGSYLDSPGGDGTPGGGGTFRIDLSYLAAQAGPTYGLPSGWAPQLAKQQGTSPSGDPFAPYNTVLFSLADESVLYTLTLTPSGGGAPITARLGLVNGAPVQEFTFFLRFFTSGELVPTCTWPVGQGKECRVGDVALTNGATLTGALQSVSFDVARRGVPEPGTLALFGFGVAGLLASVRTRRR